MKAATVTSSSNVALFARVSRSSDRVIIPINDSALDEKSRTPAFYCVHSISGTVRTDFTDLAARLEPAVRFYGIQAPPKSMQDATFGGSIQALAEHYVNALVAFQPDGPILLGGYCAGAVVALEMARNLIARGRELGPLVVIDGAPENTRPSGGLWRPRLWLKALGNLRGWALHADLIRNASVRSWTRSLLKNSVALTRRLAGVERGKKLGGGYTIESLMDVSPYSPEHRSFIERLFSALFAYVPEPYALDVLVYEAKITPLLYLPEYGGAWRMFAPKTQIIPVVGTHIAMMHEPYVEALARDLRARTTAFFAR